MVKKPIKKPKAAKNTSGRGQRDLTIKVKTARGRKLSSTLWLQRQLNDPYVKRARTEGMRGRAAYKISEIDDKYRFLVPGARVVDLGCAPGGWCQVAAERINATGDRPGKAVGTLLGVDLQEVEPIAGADLYVLDFMADEADEQVGVVGYEIPFNRHFYVYKPPRSLEEIDSDLERVSSDIVGLLSLNR